MKIEKTGEARLLYLTMAGIFIALLVSCNLIFKKFFAWNPMGLFNFEVSVGIIPYPLTFLITDLISEIFGRKRANDVVKVGLVASVFVTSLVYLADLIPAMPNSPLSDEAFSNVFGLTGAAVSASMFAYLIAQFVDIRIFHFWKKLTKGDHLWLRNNFSTIFSQLIDTSVVLSLLCAFGAIPWELFGGLFLSGFLFKVIVAALDTPLLYIGVWGIKRYFGLDKNEEIHFDQ